jgi:hypothetical protein
MREGFDAAGWATNKADRKNAPIRIRMKSSALFEALR